MESKGKEQESDQMEKDQPKSLRKSYQRLTPAQAQHLEGFFNECPLPDDKQRAQLSIQLDLTPTQVKYWFQNKRSNIKAQVDRSDNCFLRQEQQMLLNENHLLRQTLNNAICQECRGPHGMQQMISNIEYYNQDNQRLTQEIENVSAIVYGYLGRSAQQVAAIDGQPQSTDDPDLGIKKP
ncbi:hypothetical protein SUGI_1059770 [Cryptomeria japonica]|nr:hypothetical protein SUGI_1059770 [Cryptomeria japonica]